MIPAAEQGAIWRSIEDYFAEKPATFEIFRGVYERSRSLGTFDVEVRSQISFGSRRKFAWFWLYNVTQKNPNGILHTMLAIDARIDDPHVRHIAPVGKHRWNHQVVIRTMDDARSEWLMSLLHAAHLYGSR